jgi:GIY-YIG catalytic domain
MMYRKQIRLKYMNDVPDAFMIVYVIENMIDRKKYVGKTIHYFKTRIIEHIFNSQIYDNNHLYIEMKRLGVENFKWYIIGKAKTRTELLMKEKKTIIKYKTYDDRFGYNIHEKYFLKIIEKRKNKSINNTNDL